MKFISFSAGLFILIHTCQLIESAKPKISENEPDEFNLTTVEIIEKYGYPAEIHTTVTEDGYILELHRIPHGKNSTKPGFPILLAHPLFFDSAVFALFGEKSLGFFLANLGYDVWLMNFRGTHYGRAHLYLSIKDRKFWDFSFHEFGVYDTPACVNYIRGYTGNEDILYLGYSMGTTAFAVFGSERPEYQKYIRGAVLLGPAIILKHTKSLSRFIYVPIVKMIQLFSGPRSIFSSFQDSAMLQKAIKFGCNSTKAGRDICIAVTFLIGGIDPVEFNKSAIANGASHLSSTSTKVTAHFVQLFSTNEFQQYDYGKSKNKAIYNSRSPPIYHLESINIPISICIGLNDVFANPKNTLRLTQKLPLVKSVYVAPQKTFNHLDYLAGKHIEETIYPEIARRLKNFLDSDRVILEKS